MRRGTSRYLKLRDYSITVGISHHLTNLGALLNYAYSKGYIAIIPFFPMEPRHNSGKKKKTQLTEYIDYDTLTLDGEPIQVCLDDSQLDPSDIAVIDPSQRLLRKDPLFADIPNRCMRFQYVKEIRDTAEAIVSQITDNGKNEYTCIHVRRTDRMTNRDHARDTSVPRILDRIQKCENKLVYIMTDESPMFFAELQSNPAYRVLLYTGFDILRKIKIQDNYMLFCVENLIMKGASKRVSTFRSSPAYYNYSLSDVPGWQ